ncbi:MAG: GNAT family N-acetyltransferase [Alphaproteobacteria bacterium]|nr:GNAT family N-acetyltransferase [Alphaproteobacteria bacterium]
MRLAACPLENAFVRLEPLEARHRDGLRAAAEADRDIWERLYPYSLVGEHFEPYWQRTLREQDAGSLIGHAVMVDGSVIGVSCILAIDPVNATVEIGGTYYRPECRGGVVNPAAKHLLLGHVFASGARRAGFKVDALNARSRAAVLKLGATQEGILRRDRVCWTGRIRDTVVFSILAEEWPAVSDRLLSRLADAPATGTSGPTPDR